ncbi:MAG: hypothetical protein IPK34_08240 [Ramlibacter sp.]|nr:hypothetical protein [Ramlibacter sp.]
MPPACCSCTAITPDPICRIDLARYLILHVHGGLYCDIDFECFQNVERLLDEAAFVIGLEPDSHAREPQIFGTRPEPGPEPCLDGIDSGSSIHAASPGRAAWTATQVDVLDRTGPFFLTRVFQGIRCPGIHPAGQRRPAASVFQ